MKVLKDGSWQLDSALEADAAGRALGYERGASERYYFSHRPGELAATLNEVEFFYRTLKYGALVISNRQAQEAERGLRTNVLPQFSSQRAKTVGRPIAAAMLRIVDVSQATPTPEDIFRSAA